MSHETNHSRSRRNPPLDLPNAYDVFQADRMARLVVQEYAASQLRVLEEDARRNGLVAEESTPCRHDELSVYRYVRSPFDDHEIAIGQCGACERWIHRTIWLARAGVDATEDRALTAAERDALQAMEDRCRREEAS